MVDWLCGQTELPEQIAVGIETPHGPIVEALMDRGVAVFAINPEQLDRFRDRLSPAGAEDDRRDALVLALSLRTDRHCFRRVQAMDPAVVELREWSRMAEELKGERVRLSNRVRQQLWRYYPQFLELTDDIGAEWVLALWTKSPTPAEAARLTEKKVARILASHRIRRISAADVLAIVKRPALTVAPGFVEAACSAPGSPEAPMTSKPRLNATVRSVTEASNASMRSGLIFAVSWSKMPISKTGTSGAPDPISIVGSRLCSTAAAATALRSASGLNGLPK